MGALDQLRVAGRRVGALQRRARWGVADAGKRAGGAVSRAGKSVTAAPARAFERIRSDAGSAEPWPGSAPERDSEPSALSRLTAWIRENPRVTIAIVGGVLLVCAWIAWAVYVTSENGASAGLGVMIAWPAVAAALVLISLPLIGGYMLFRGLSTDEGNPESAAEPTAAEPTDHRESEGEEDSNGEEGDEDAEPDGDESGEDAEPEEAAAS